MVDFEDLALPPESFYNGFDRGGGFVSGGAHFRNEYDAIGNSWLGWSLSNRTDVLTPGFMNQYSSFAGGGFGGSGGGNFAVGFTHGITLSGTNIDPADTRITLPAGLEPVSMQVTNTTYTALSILHGDGFAKRFGGPTGNDPDFFSIRVLGYDAEGSLAGSVEHFLADYRFADNAADYIVSQWQEVDLASLRGLGVRSLSFNLESSDTGFFGVNTPAYFALDNLLLAPPKSTDPSVPGDTNLDGVVSRDDVVAVMASLGQSSGAVWQSGDFDRDGRVSLADVAILQSHFGVVGPITVGGGPQAVPEPATAFVAACGALFALIARRRRIHPHGQTAGGAEVRRGLQTENG
jgi:hypothetical protein